MILMGWKLFTDLVFADFLVTYTRYVSKVIFQCVILWFLDSHPLNWAISPKLFPWFVSDVTPADFADLFASILSPSFPNASPVLAIPENRFHLEAMVNRWKSYLASGVFALSVPEDTQLGAKHVMAGFWTEPWPYWDMKDRASELFRWLTDSQLVIFKVSSSSYFCGPVIYNSDGALTG